MTDIRIDNEDGHFKFRVCGIIILDGKVLTVKIKDNDFYCLPGGHIELGESTEEAVVREITEEVGCKVLKTKLKFICQNFFKSKDNKIFHELAYYYLLEIDKNTINKNDYEIIENDKGVLKSLKFFWLDEEQLKNYDFRPGGIKEHIFSNEFNLHLTNK